ncbi:hypothetical protein [Streptomyces sp. NPDC059165]|uniref:hypothetical protein n=1 Tax=Streptomyces sp. NPDC059165 TaxID=3346751 RepID=UPI003679C4A8
MLQFVDWHVQAQSISKRSDLPKKPTAYPRWWDQGQRRQKNSPKRLARLEEARERARERQRLIDAGAIA